ncbi:MAG: NERD domain-containing protein [Gammaproteobacteria bacterium]|nr:NERD domain-containing protein [Rhodospirillaceae bacterium]MDE0365129.1 NERD domain-containing protein [Gammaproteobacteria bacterium]
MRLGRILGALFGTASGKGYIGESKVSIAARFALPKSIYTPIHDVTLPTPDGTTQIDHIFVSRFGVFVVETKNMAGWIFGGERDRQWTQMFRGGKKARFLNPLRQNYRHVKAVEAAIADVYLPHGAVKSVVAFVGNAELKTEMPANVTVGAGFTSYIRSFSEPILHDHQVAVVHRKIESEALSASAATDRQHVRNLRSRQNPESPRKCPRCGKNMVLRNTRRGPNAGRRFWGCSGYPACRYTCPE